MLRRLAFLVAGAALVVGACSSTPAAPALTDPKEILTKSVESLKDVKSFHLKAEVSGQIKLDLTGQGSAGGALDLQGTTAEGDVDIANKKAKVTFGAPALFGVTGELIQIGDDTYTKVSLLGDKYQKSTSDSGDVGKVAGDPQKAIQELRDFLNKPGIAPTKLADERCGDKDCYHVSLNLTEEQLGDSIGGALGASDAPTGSGTLDLWAQKDNLRPAKLAVVVDAGDMGKVTITITLTNYDAAVSISEPPADQVQTE
ncbi:MAG: LppX_LprAFG lipoprotein [Chloroflexi bacterium]|nr:LppX_LprAFG lipoprotein [Chloroflexota bacterium]